MKKTAIVLAMLGISLIGCLKQEVPTTQAQCEQTLCKKDNCLVWSTELNRCGTSDALKKEEARLKKIARKANQKDSVKAEVPKSVRDSLAKIEKKVKKIKTEIRDLNKIADSLQVADSLSGKPLLATAYLKDELNKEKAALDIKYKALMDSVEVLNLVNHKPITAVQWIKYNKIQKKNRLEKLEKKLR